MTAPRPCLIPARKADIKWETPHLHEIDDGPALAEHVLDYARLYNETRPHVAIDWAQPLTRYTANQTWTINPRKTPLPTRQLTHLLDTGHSGLRSSCRVRRREAVW